MYGEHQPDRLRGDIRQVDTRHEMQAANFRDTLSGLGEANQRLDQAASLAHVDGKVSEFWLSRLVGSRLVMWFTPRYGMS